MIKWSIDNDRNYIDTLYSGEITIQQVLDYHASIETAFPHQSSIRIYNDIRKCNFNFDMHDIPQFVASIQKAVRNYERVRSVYLTDDPKISAIMSVYEIKVIGIEHYHIQHFSTEKAARAWLEP